MIDISSLKLKVLSNEMEDSVRGIDESINLVGQISELLIEGISQSKDRFITTERISLLFNNYLEKLRSLVKGNDSDLGFWAASLIMHYNLPDNTAENILLNAIRFGDIEKADVATVILCRNRNQKVVYAIIDRLKDSSLSKKSKDFFIEKINDLASSMVASGNSNG